jgi:alcohol dehydrogenase class IV
VIEAPAAINLPRIIEFGAGASANLAAVLGRLGHSRPFLVVDGHLLQSGLLDRVIGPLDGAFEHRVFSDIVPDPTVAAIRRGLAALAEGGHDCVVGIGGGSALDTAKALAVFSVHGGDPADYKAPHVQDAPGLPVIAIPTTAGTGSEATRFTVITDETTDEKMLCAGLAYLPVAALVDFELTLGKPVRLTVDTAIDSLTHAIEAYVSRRANAFSDGMAVLAMGNIAGALRDVVADPGHRPGRAALMLGATQAGIAFSNSSVALVHGMSRPIGAAFHVPHGLSNAMLLPAVTEFSSGAALPRYADCARAMGVAQAGEGDQSAVGRLHGALRDLNRDLAVPGPRAYGIDEARWFDSLDMMAAQALASGSPANNPRVATQAEIRAIYERVWHDG